MREIFLTSSQGLHSMELVIPEFIVIAIIIIIQEFKGNLQLYVTQDF
jgi:hypothetical protein